MAVRSDQLFAGRVTSTGLTSLYTVPVGKRTIVKWFSGYNGTAALLDLILLTTNPGGNATYARNPTLAVGATMGGATWLVLNEGDQLQAFAGAEPFDVHAHGAELALP